MGLGGRLSSSDIFETTRIGKLSLISEETKSAVSGSELDRLDGL